MRKRNLPRPVYICDFRKVFLITMSDYCRFRRNRHTDFALPKHLYIESAHLFQCYSVFSVVFIFYCTTAVSSSFLGVFQESGVMASSGFGQPRSRMRLPISRKQATSSSGMEPSGSGPVLVSILQLFLRHKQVGAILRQHCNVPSLCYTPIVCAAGSCRSRCAWGNYLSRHFLRVSQLLPTLIPKSVSHTVKRKFRRSKVFGAGSALLKR